MLAKLLKIVSRIIGGTLEWTLIAFIVIAFLIRTSTVQTYIAQAVTDFLSKDLNTEIHISKVDLYFFNRVNLEGVFVRDLQGDTLASLGSIGVQIGSLGLEDNKIIVKSITLSNGRVGINRAAKTGDYNYWFLQDYFASDSPSSKKDPPEVTIESIVIKDVKVSYDDFRKSYSDFGMDYDHLVFNAIQLDLSNIKVHGNTIDFQLNKLATFESRSGFQLNKLSAKCRVSEKGLLMKNATINTPKTQLNLANLKLHVNRETQYAKLDAIITSSKVDFEDVVQFAPTLRGMKDLIMLETQLSVRGQVVKVRDMDLRVGKRSIIRGSLDIPDFRKFDEALLNENVEYAFLDLQDIKSFRLPDSSPQHYLSFDPMIERLEFCEIKQLQLHGSASQFVLSSKKLSTKLGAIRIDNGLVFNSLKKEGGYTFKQSTNSKYDVAIDSFQLGKFIDDELLGTVNGSLFLNGVVGQQDVIRLTKISGKMNQFGFNDYNYTGIEVAEGSFINNIFDANITIKDPHLDLTFDGFVDLNNGQKFDFNANIAFADLNALNLSNSPIATLQTGIDVKLSGNSIKNYAGVIQVEQLTYQENEKKIDIPELALSIERYQYKDIFSIVSEFATIRLEGKIDPSTIATSLNNLLVEPLSAYFTYKPLLKKTTENNHFELDITTHNTKDILAIFAPDLYIAPNSTFAIDFDAVTQKGEIAIQSKEIRYQTTSIKALQLNQKLENGNLDLSLESSRFSLNDSIHVDQVSVLVDGSKNVYDFSTTWYEGKEVAANFAWKTTFGSNNDIGVRLKPSFFTVKGQLWEIMNSANLYYADKKVKIDHLVLERDVQFIAINGTLSDNRDDEIRINLNDLHIEEFTSLIDPTLDIKGSVSGDIRISTPFTTLKIDGDVSANELIINKEPIGNVAVNANWDSERERILLTGDLNYLNNETFDFTGYYYPYQAKNNIDFDLTFQGMDLQFANSFMDPTVVRDIRGKLKGDIKLTGSSSVPNIDGKLNIENGNVKIGILGTSFRVNGPIEFDGENNAFYLNRLPITDEEGNSASITGSVNHTEFANWNVDLGFNIEDDYTRIDRMGNPKPIERFLVLNTPYKEGEVYYGRAYVTGTADIFVAEDNTDIEVNVKTEKGTSIGLPMYGNSELTEADYIEYKKLNQGEIAEIKDREIDFTGVNLNMNFDVTPDAKVKLIFNDKTGDEITASGSGDLSIKLDNLGDLSMNGQYIMKEGLYNFVLGPIKQKFFIQEGGTITWTGDPVNANLDLKAYNKVSANINEIVQDVTGTKSSNQDVYCTLELTQSLSEPQINLDIQIPKASESTKAVLNRIRSDKDELQKQFFSLLLFKKFAPLTGNASASGGGLADVLENQINTILDGVSDDIKLRADYDATDIDGTSNSKYKLGASKAFGQNENIIIKGSFGVANSESSDSKAQSSLIGDMSIEYIINKDGTFRVNLFNESNDNTVIADKQQGLFTQGVGVHYQEDFNTVKDFQLAQSILNLFRKEKRVKTDNRNKRKVPVKPLNGNAVLEEEKK